MPGGGKTGIRPLVAAKFHRFSVGGCRGRYRLGHRGAPMRWWLVGVASGLHVQSGYCDVGSPLGDTDYHGAVLV